MRCLTQDQSTFFEEILKLDVSNNAKKALMRVMMPVIAV